VVAAFVHHRGNPITRHNIDHGWALDNRLARLPLALKPDTPYRALALDVHGKAVGDPNAVAFNTRGDRLVLSAGGTGEVLCFMGPDKLWSPGDAGDFMDIDLEQDGARLRRVPVGGRPVALGFVEGTELVAVANYLLDSVQIIDATRGEVIKQIPLGGPQRPSLERRGEALFYDARRSHHQWFSCHTCHTDGHTSGRLFDTLNDDSYGNAKLTPSLRGVARTGPYTWHGWQEQLEEAVHKSLVDTMFGKQQPTKDEVQALSAFLATLDHPPNPRKGAAAVNNGRDLFLGKAGCVRCHGGEEYATPRNYALRQSVDDNSGYELWNPPSLRGVVDRGPFLHNGRAETLDELLRVHHVPEKLGGEALTPDERTDLIAFLRSL
jgi:cytochrome c peroxidase